MASTQSEPQLTENCIVAKPKPNCILCGCEGELLYSSLEDRLFGAPGSWNFKQCPSAQSRLVWLDAMPAEEDIHKAYTVYHTRQENFVGSSHLPLPTGLRRKFRAALDRVYSWLLYPATLEQASGDFKAMYLARHEPGRLLEIGCGNGRFLDQMRSMGWEVQGVEVDPKAAQIAKQAFGVPV